MGRKWTQEQKDRLSETMRKRNAGEVITPKYDDSLRGYSSKIHIRDNFICQYCGVDGKTSFNTWVTLSSEHLLPRGHTDRDNPDYIVTACNFCNVADNHFFEYAEERSLIFDGRTPEQLVEQRKPYVMKRREEYMEYWKRVVNPLAE